MKKIITLLIMVIFALCLYATTSTTDAIDITTNDGDTNTRALGLQFTLIENGTAYEVSRGSATATEIVIPETYNFLPVTRIADNGFNGFSNLTRITIPSGVTSIGNSAFRGCSSLTSIDIPSRVTSIGYATFYGCSSLISIGIPEGVTIIESSSFTDCSSLISISIPASVTSIGMNAFNNCFNLTNILVNVNNQVYRSEGNCLIQCSNQTLILGCQTSDIPTDILSIGASAFYGCSNLTSTIIPEGITSIGASAFYGCSNLTSIIIPDGVTSIGSSAFYGCSNLTSIIIPDGVTSIGSSAFYGCSNLTSIFFPSGITDIESQLFYGCSNLVSIIIPEGVISVGVSAFEGCVHLVSITIPEGVVNIGSRAFWSCSNLLSMTIPASVRSIGSQTFVGCYNLTGLVIPEGVTTIEQGTFSDCYSLTSITLPESITSIGSTAFYRCYNLNSIIIPGSVTNIGEYAFSTCSSLTSITIPMSVTSIGGWAFVYCYSLVIFTELTNHPVGWVSGWSGDRPVVWGNGASELAFTLLDDGTAYQVSRGTTINTIIIIPSTYNNLPIVRIADNGFNGFATLTSISISEYVTNIGESAFSGCSSLTNIILPTSVTSIGPSAFSDCSNLSSITIPANVTSIEPGTFWGCSGLTNIIVEEDNLFYRGEGNCLIQRSNNTLILGCQISDIPVWVTSIEVMAFGGCSNLTNIVIPEGVVSIGSQAFYGCSSLTSITIPEGVTNINPYTFSYCSNLSSITIPESVILIGEQAFSDCSSLSSIYIPEGVTNIGATAFYGCSNLLSITIPDGVTDIPYRAFSNCLRLTSVTIPESVTFIGQNAFYRCSSLTNISIPEGVNYIGSSAFQLCSSLTSIIIPEGVTNIAYQVLSQCYNLTSISLPMSITNIEDSAFRVCSNLISITIPNNVLNIGREAFYYCSSLTSITIPERVVNIGSLAFIGCNSSTIFTELTSQPTGWVNGWNGGRPVIWGVTTDPIAPTSLVFQNIDNTIQLAWVAPTGVYIPNFISYAIYRDDILLADTGITNPNYTDVVTELGEHTYTVKAVYTTGISDPSNEITVNIENIEYNHLPPTNLQAVVSEAQTVTLSWEAPDADGLLSYKIYRMAGSAEVFTLLDQTIEHEYVDTQVVAGMLYEYYVTAVYPAGESVPTDIVQAIFYSLVPPTNLLAIITESISITLNWEAPDVLGVENYKLYRREIATDEFAILNQIASGEVLSYNDTDVEAGITYQYCVTAVYPVGESPLSNIIFVVFYYMLPPENLVVANPDSPSVILNWEAPEAVGLSGYKVYRKTGADGEFVELHQTTELSFEDTQVEENVTYQYYVTGVYPSGESGISNIVTAIVRPLSDNDIVGVAVTRLAGNYPNPFNPTTTISFDMASEGNVVIEVYSVKGQLVRKLVNGVRGVGSYKVVWDGRDDSGRGVSSGVYFYRMVTGDYKNVKKMVMVK